VKSRLPNLLSLARLVLTAPLLLVAIMAGSRTWFFVLLCLAWTTDALDGYLARRWHVESELGRMLDSWGDYVTTLLCVLGLAWLWPELMQREWPWLVIGLVGFFAIVIFGLLQRGRPPAYHTWMAKALAVGFPFAFAALLAGWSATPFHWIMALQVVAAIDEMIIYRLLPDHNGEMRSAWHAWHRRRHLSQPSPGNPPSHAPH